MALGTRGRRLRHHACVALLACAAAMPPDDLGLTAKTPARPRMKPAGKVLALSPWEQAERGREAFEATPDETRTRAGYQHAIDAYRAIYHGNPRDPHAAAAVNAVAELLAEQGRGLRDGKSSTAALGQYAFLRKQYPASSLGVPALLAEAQIAQNDLADPAAARELYSLLLKQHPKSSQAEEARAGLASLTAEEPAPRRQAARHSSHRDAATAEARPSAPIANPSSLPPTPQTATTNTIGMQTATNATNERDASNGSNAVSLVKPSNTPMELADAQTRPDADPTGARRMGSKAVVSGIRHWSTSTYTRVAIDLGDNVTYEAARVPNPDRIYFDLHGTRLAQELIGKSFAVTDDGFLKKIRAAQFSDDMTRVVLDVNDVTEYSAFLLPNPYRLIIDIHGKTGNREQGTGSREKIADAGLAVAPGLAPPPAPAPRTALNVKVTDAKPVPNTVATRSPATGTDVADLSALPGKVDATRKPTSKPISAVVPAGPGTASASPQIAATSTPSPVGTPGVPPPVSSRSTGTRTSAPKVVAANTLAIPARAAVPTADGETSLVRALGLKIGRIVIDAGHGGHDSGTLGVDGIEEKDVVLDVALRVGKLLHDRLGAEVIYTRSDDTFIPLETRTAIANKAQADLFLSIHANSSSDPTARGVETYYLNFTSDPAALEVAARENAVGDQSVHQLSDLVKKIALKDKISESREFAGDVEASLYGGLQAGNAGLKNRGVKKAPFVVLIGANMPSILAEISFVTNARDATQLREPDYRQRVAESLYRGVARYEGGLSAARRPTERAGQ